MARVAVVTDSTAYVPKDLCEKYHITTVPQILIWGQETLEDGVDILPDQFYSRLLSAKVMPTTSQVSVASMHKAFSQLLSQGYEVLGIFVSGKLSGTMLSASQGRDELAAGKEKVEIVDSNSTAMAMGFQALSAARAAADGAGLADCKKLAEECGHRTGVYFAVDTLEFLHRGGRIGGAQRFLGTALNLKPILALQDGKVEAIDRVRTRGKALDRVIELVSEQCQGKSPIHLATLHANALEDARDILARASKQLNAVESIVSEVSPVVGNHAGPGTVGLAYLAGI